MFTVLSNARNSNLYLIVAIALTLVVILTFAVVPSIAAPKAALIPETAGQAAHDLFRQEELAVYDRPAPSSIGSPAFYEYRRGEWSLAPVDAMGEFRQEELTLYDRPTMTSSLGSAAFYEYRRGEWSIAPVDAMGAFRQEELSLYNRPATSSMGSPAHYEYRQGEWFGD